MRNKFLVLGITLMLATLVTTTQVISQDKPTPKKPAGAAASKEKPASAVASKAKAAPSFDEEMAAWAKYAEPGENHKRLKAFEGTWEATTKMWMAPEAPPQESKGVSENKLILGGRFLQQDYKAEFMGKPFSGLGLTGYDNYKKKYTAIWTDTMSTMVIPSSGTFDKTGKVLTSFGAFDDVVSGKKKKFKSVVRIVDDNKHTFEWYEDKDGKMVKTMEATYTRK